MTTWTIKSTASGADLGTYEAESRDGALDATAREQSGDDGAHLVVEAVRS